MSLNLNIFEVVTLIWSFAESLNKIVELIEISVGFNESDSEIGIAVSSPLHEKKNAANKVAAPNFFILFKLNRVNC